MSNSRAIALAPIVASLLFAIPAAADTDLLVGGGPNVGLWDVADGHHTVGLYTVAMVHLGTEKTASFRLDGSYSYFWAEGNQNVDYDVLTFLANLVLAFGGSDRRPYWTLGIGYDFPSEGDQDPQYIAGTGVGIHFGWGIIEGRFDAARTSGGLGMYVPIFAALSF